MSIQNKQVKLTKFILFILKFLTESRSGVSSAFFYQGMKKMEFRFLITKWFNKIASWSNLEVILEFLVWQELQMMIYHFLMLILIVHKLILGIKELRKIRN